MKYKIIILIIFVVSLLVVERVDGYVNEMPLLGKVIYLDPGHGGVDPGAIYKDIYEEDITLQITKKLQLMLEQKGAIVYITREGDYDLSLPKASLRKRSDLSKRVKLINDSNCDMYLSVHLNASNSTSWKGAQVFYNNINKDNKELAQYLQDAFKKDLKSNRKIKEIKDLYMYKNVKRPGLLLEVGYITNANERYLMLKDYYQQRIAMSITSGVLNYFREKSNQL